MGYFNFQNDVTSINDTNLNAMQKGLMELVFPIGSTYITQDNTNPNTILGFGIWERFKGLIALGLDENDVDFNEIGKTGGEKEHTLTIDEMPSHRHKIKFEYASSGTDRTSIGTSSGSLADDRSTEYVGGGKPHNNKQPYEIVGYMWIRRE